MLLSELQEIFADRRRAPGDLRSMLEQCARALGEAACGETCEIWIWRSAVEGDRHLERIALFGQGLVENPLAVLDTEWSYPREFHIEPEAEPEVEPEGSTSEGRQFRTASWEQHHDPKPRSFCMNLQPLALPAQKSLPMYNERPPIRCRDPRAHI